MQPETVINRLGGPTRAAERLGLKRTTVTMWRKRGVIPVAHVPAVSAATGVPRHELRPDLYEAPAEAA